jgi:hypothetical protein
LSQFKQEYEEQLRKNQDKRHRLELYEGLGIEYRKLAEKHMDMEKKIKYTKITLDQLDATFK